MTSGPMRPVGARRQRKTVQIDPTLYARRLTECAELERSRRTREQPLVVAGRELAVAEPNRLDGRHPEHLTFIRAHLQAILKAFIDAARPAGGMVMGADGLPAQLDDILRAGMRYSEAGDSLSKLERNVRAGLPVDRRLADAALCFFRIFLERSHLALDEMGACEADRVRTARGVEAAIRRARSGLPDMVVEGLLRRAEETASYVWLFQDFVREYRDLQLVRDAHGVARIHLLRITRYRAIKLASFERLLQPTLTYEWHEWARFESATLTMRRINRDGRHEPELALPVRKRHDEKSGLLVYDIHPDRRGEFAEALWSPESDAAEGHVSHEFEWRERLVLNAADRDMLVSYAPVDRPEVRFDHAANPDFLVTVGDSPGLETTATGWQMERTLLPREVLAIRIRWSGLTARDALSSSPIGELSRAWPAQEAAHEAPEKV